MGNGGRIRRSVRGARWVVAVGIVLGAVLGLFADLQIDHTPVSSTSQLLVSDGALGQSSSDAASTVDQYVSARMATYAELATDNTVLAPVAAQLDTTVPALQEVVRVTPVDGTTMLSIAARAATPAEATADDAAVTSALATAITGAETFGSDPSLVTVSVTSPPSTPDPVSVPPLGLVSVAGALAGGLVVLLGAVLWGSGVLQRLGRRVDDLVFDDPAQTIRP